MNTGRLNQHPMLQAIGLPKVFDAIEAAGGEARIVGGAVRNALLDRPVHEIDIATTLEPDATMAAARAAGLKAHPTGSQLVASGKKSSDLVPFERNLLRYFEKKRLSRVALNSPSPRCLNQVFPARRSRCPSASTS